MMKTFECVKVISDGGECGEQAQPYIGTGGHLLCKYHMLMIQLELAIIWGIVRFKP